jgi:hypothetical protein
MAENNENMDNLNETVRKLDDSMRQMSERNEQMAAAMLAMMGNMTGVGKSMKDSTITAEQAAKSLKNLQKGVDENTEAEKINTEMAKKYAEAMANFSKAATSSTTALTSMTSAVLSGKDGFEKYNNAIKNAGDAAWSLGKNFGILGTVLGGVIKGMSIVAEMATKQADDVLKATDNFSKLGGAGALTAKQVLDMGHKAGLTAANLEVMTKAAAKANTGMGGLGSTLGEGIVAFGKMTAVTSEQRQAFQRLGVSQEELMARQADYVKLQEMSGKSLASDAKSGDKLRKQSLEYAENLSRLSALTGKSADQLQGEQNAAMLEYEEIVATRIEDDKIRKLKAEGRKEEADSLEKEQKARKAYITQVTNQLGKEAGLQVGKVARTGSYDSSTAGLAALGVTPDQVQKGYKGKSEEEARAGAAAFTQTVKEKQSEKLGQLGTALQYGGEDLGKKFFLGKESLQETGKFAERDENKANQEATNRTKGAAAGASTAGGVAATDPAQKARNELTEMEIKARVKVDELVASMNPLLNGFNATTIAATALAAAAAAAALALGVMAGKSLLGKIGGGEGKGKAGGKGKTPAPRGPDGRFVKAGATATKGAGMVGTLGKGAAGLGKIAGPAGAVVSVGMGLHSAYEGAKDVDERVKSGELTKAEGTVKKSEAVGSGLGSAAGGAAGAWGGAAAGAAIGSVVPVVGTVIGGLLGAAVGGWLGSKGGEVVGEKVGKVTGEALKETGTPSEKKAIEDKKAEVTKDSTKATDTLNKTYLSNKKAMEDLTQAINDLSNIATSKDQPGSPEDKAKRLEQIYARLSGGGGSGGGGSGGGGAAAPSGGGGGGKATAPSSSGGGKAGSSPPTLSPQAPDGSTDSTSKIKPEDVIKFTARSGSKESFDALDGGIKNAVLNAAEEYKASTGKIIQLNSAKRDPADQQRLYDDWVARGKTGMPVGKPGRSLHEKGQAVDIQNYNDPAAVAAFNKQGLSQKVPNDPVHFQARNGGLFSGPNSGYDVTLHGREMVIPTPDVSKMFDGKNNVDKQELSSVFNQQNTNNMQSGDTATVDMLAKLMEMMEEKMDDMIDKLSDSHSTQEQLLKYSKA